MILSFVSAASMIDELESRLPALEARRKQGQLLVSVVLHLGLQARLDSQCAMEE